MTSLSLLADRTVAMNDNVKKGITTKRTPERTNVLHVVAPPAENTKKY